MKKVILSIILAINFLSSQAIACNSLANRYSLTYTEVTSGNVSSSLPVSCTYYIHKAKTINNNRFLYSGTECTGIYRTFTITKSCNNISFSLPATFQSLAVDSFGNAIAQEKTTYLNCIGSLSKYKAILGDCSGQDSGFVFSGSFNAYRNRQYIARNQNINKDSKLLARNKYNEQIIEGGLSLFNQEEK